MLFLLLYPLIQLEILYGSNKGKTHGQIITEHAKNFYIKKCNEYGIEISEANVNYLIQNI